MTIEEAQTIKEYKNGKLSVEYILEFEKEFEVLRKEILSKFKKGYVKERG